MRETQQFITCACHDSDHLLILSAHEDGDHLDFTLQYHLSPFSFFDRLKVAWNVICGKRSKYGDYAEFVINRQGANDIKLFIDDCLDDKRFV
jgi:hypothetical protein